MGDSVEISGKTLEEAIEAAAGELGVTVDAVKYEVLDPGTKGFLGLGQSPVTIKAWVCEEPEMAAGVASEAAPVSLAELDESTRSFIDTVMGVLQDLSLIHI